MPTPDPRIDAYIARAQPFARPILEHLRGLVRDAVPEAEETMKWSMPHFTVSGKIVAGMASFKAHAAFIIKDAGRQGGEAEDGMGSFGKLTSLADLPPDNGLRDLLRRARDQVAAGMKPPKPAKAPKAEIAMPDDFAAALGTMQGAREQFEALSPSARREYLAWIVDAKRPETRAKRIAKACGQIAEGKKLNWKYESC